MDVLRGFFILLVMSLHATLIVELFDHAAWPPLIALNDIFAPYRMPALMFLSGLLLHRSLHKGPVHYVEGKIRNIVYPYIVWTCVFGLVVKPEFEWHNPWLWMGASYLWYIFFLLIAYAAAPLLRPINSAYIAVACVAVSFVMPDGSKYAERLFCLLGYFFLGDYVGRSPGFLEKIRHPAALFLCLPPAAVFSWVSVVHDVTYRPELFLPTIAGIVVSIHAAFFLADRAAGRYIRFVGEHSMVYYTAHYPLMFCVTGGLLMLDPGNSKLAIAAAAFVSAVIACTVLAWACLHAAAVRAAFVLPVTWRPGFWLARIRSEDRLRAIRMGRAR